MHLFAPEIGMMGTSGIVGPCILQAAGAGYSFKLLERDNVGVAFFGDGAVNNGAFHEGLNLASIWKLPVLFVCENNQFATEVPFAYAAGNPDVGGRGAAYGIPGITLDGNDVLAIHQAAGEAIRRARSGGGPTLIECRTYRTRAHAEGMGDFTYRTKEDVEEWKRRCPIQRLRLAIQTMQLDLPGSPPLSERDLDSIDAEVAAQINEAQQFAEQSPWPEPASATTHVYAPPRAADEPDSPGSRETTYIKATWEALAAAMEADRSIFVFGEGIGKRGGNFQTTLGLYERFGPTLLCDTPIAERGFVGLAGGAAMTGSRPVVDFMFADFVLDSVGEIINQIAKIQYMSSGRIRMPILMRGCIGIGHSAATHHSGSYHTMYGHFPGLRVAVPATPFDAKGLFIHALRSHDPVLFLEHRELLSSKGPVPDFDYEIPFGKGRIARPGKDVTIVALAFMVRKALEAAEQLAAQGVSVEVLDPRTIQPLDSDLIAESLHRTGRLLIVDEDFESYGFGAEVAARMADVAFDELDAPIRRLNGAFSPTPYSPVLEKAVVPSVDSIVAAVQALLEE
jgi:2-oxoisovalerate dehydrogenase E1 component